MAPRKTTPARGRRTGTTRAATTTRQRQAKQQSSDYPPGYVPHWGDGGINGLGSSIVLPIVTKFTEGVMEGLNNLLKFCALQAQMSDALFVQNQHLISERAALLNLGGGTSFAGIELPGAAPAARQRRRASTAAADAVPAGA